MNEIKLKYAYFLGIGGIGMSAIARYFHSLGVQVCGYDRTPTPLTDALQEEGIQVHFDDNAEHIPAHFLTCDPAEVLFVYTPAIPKDHAEYNYLQAKGIKILKRSEVLGVITRNAYSVAVAGTHGKTTTSTLIAHLLRHSGANCTAFLGGISSNYGTNYLPATDSKSSTVVVEADEYDRSFLQLQPDIAVITSMDADHLDIYGEADELTKSFHAFAALTAGTLFYKAGLPLETASLRAKVYTYTAGTTGDYRAANIRIADHAYHFDLHTPDKMMEGLTLGLPGRHNVENAVAAAAVALQLGLTEPQLRQGLQSFAGVKRRFEYIVNTPEQVFIDDYAHHPEELKACILSVKELYPGRKVTGIFQPHLFTRTRDFAAGFAASLDLLDQCILLDIYPARELPLPGITSQVIFDLMHLEHKTMAAKEQLPELVRKSATEVLLTLGAGDIDQWVLPIRKSLTT